MPKIKAQKVVREGDFKSKSKKESRRMQWFLLLILIMIVSGFVLGGVTNSFGSGGGGGQAQDYKNPSYYFVASKLRSELAAVGETSDNYAVLASGRTPSELRNRFGGEIIEIEGSSPVLHAGDYGGLDKVRDAAGEGSIIYKFAKCAGATNYTCLVDLNATTGQEAMIDVYQLDKNSTFAGGDTLGLVGG